MKKFSNFVLYLYLASFLFFLGAMYLFLWKVTEGQFPPPDKLIPLDQWPSDDRETFLSLVYTSVAAHAICYLCWLGIGLYKLIAGLWKAVSYLIDDLAPGRMNPLRGLGRSHRGYRL